MRHARGAVPPVVAAPALHRRRCLSAVIPTLSARAAPLHATPRELGGLSAECETPRVLQAEGGEDLSPGGGVTVAAAVAAVCQVECAETRHVGCAVDLRCALEALQRELERGAAATAAAAAAAGADTACAGWPCAYGSGVLRLEVSLPRGGIDALLWLRGLPPHDPAALPHVYFSPRAPPPSPGGGSSGVHLDAPPSWGEVGLPGGEGGATAGCGSAWAWRGAPGAPFDALAAARVRRFACTGAARTRALGGARFDGQAPPDEDWAPFGSYLFILPALELCEGAHQATLAATLAWDDGRAAAVPPGESGPRTLAHALAATLAACGAALGAQRARPGAATARVACEEAPRPLVTSLRHTPEEHQWTATVEKLLLGLARSAEAVAQPVAGPAALEALARLAASNGGAVAQQVLAAAGRVSSQAVPPGREGPAWDALADLARTPGGRAALQELAGRGDGKSHLEELTQRADVDMPPHATSLGVEEAADVEPVPIEVLTGGTPEDPALLLPLPAPLLGDLAQPLPLTKVVLARKSDVQLSSGADPLALLSALRRRSPGSYAFALRPCAHGPTFISSTPERLFALHAGRLATEAVAGTRPRGGDERLDAALAYELLTDPKEHAEFTIVQEWVRCALQRACRPGSVTLEAEKTLLRTSAVQHLYSRLAGTLSPGATEADVLAALHPTPAVCGAPRAAARAAIDAAECFDRGFYAGPVGWLGAGGAEFAVAIRSALVHAGGSRLSLFAGVGVVRGASPASEWRELNLKISQYQALLTLPPPLEEAPNINSVWAGLLIEEAVRCGVRLFCIAPGSRSTPLALAASRHPRAAHVVCIDERSLAFHALGASKAGALAAVITSSGTAVANLLPAAVEACEAEVPLLLLTADRPSELRGSGANQTIDQVGIFGAFARWAAEVPPPEPQGGAGAARQLLTTVDAAVARARGPPGGPVHLNCAFREPLAPSAAPWNRHVLQGLGAWRASDAPLTRYEVPAASPSGGGCDCGELLRVVASARRGIIVAGHLADGADALAVWQLAQRLGWPLVADVTSGLRVRAAASPALLPHFDLALMERAAWPQLQPDVILQFGGRLTSKRVQAFLEWSASAADHGTRQPAPWAFVARHPWRHDPGHAQALRVVAAPAAVAAALLRAEVPSSTHQAAYLRTLSTLDAALRRCVDEHLDEGDSLTEMGVARLLSRTLPLGHGLFLGNSMPVRDMDTYADVAGGATRRDSSSGVHEPVVGASGGVGAPLACNRGASGIDGVLSSASGFAAGLGRPATLLIGDVSLAHDSNGLLLLRERPGQPPLTVVVVNNGGGAIFNFLPVADTLGGEEFGRLFSTPPDVRLAELCRAHRVHHLQARTQRGLARALAEAWRLGRHAMVEVVLREDDQATRNLAQHRAAERAVRHTTRSLLAALAGPLLAPGAAAASPLRVANAALARYELPLLQPLTVVRRGGSSGREEAPRAGALLRIRLACGSQGVGDVAPLPGLHAESLPAATAQAATLCELLCSSCEALPPLCPSLQLLDGSMRLWLHRALGVRAEALLPSVRYGLEAALLAALAAARGTTLPALLCAGAGCAEAQHPPLVNALLPACESPEAAAAAARALSEAGYGCIKVKVARPGATPQTDAACLVAIRAAVGPTVALRCDSNRGWSLAQAVEFGAALQLAGCALDYLEEPTRSPDDMGAFFAATGIPTALDETLDEAVAAAAAASPALGGAAAAPLLPPGCAALVVKPSLLGGLERAAQLVRWAARRGVRCVASSSFDSSVGLAAHAALAALADGVILSDGRPALSPAHGLGTQSWFARDVSPKPFATQRCADGVAVDGAASAALLAGAALSVTFAEGAQPEVSTHEVETPSGERFSLRVFAVHPPGRPATTTPAALFLHGFMGTAHDWLPILRGLAASTGRSYAAVDLPGHGASRSLSGASQGVPEVSEAMHQLIKLLSPEPVALVGYSMGARVALHMALRTPPHARGRISRLVCISGTAGVRGGAAREARAARDDALARALRSGGAQDFSKAWYKQRLFAPLARKPGFAELEERRAQQRDAGPLADALAAMSPGRAPDLWPDLAAASPDHALPAVTFVVGSLDGKFLAAAHAMVGRAGKGLAAEVVEVRACGHAVHLEAPETLVGVLARALESAL